MKETLESLRGKMSRATELGSVVRAMKAMSASSIHQYEEAVDSLEEYYRTVELALQVCYPNLAQFVGPDDGKGRTGVFVFGSGQGLVGRFNDLICRYTVSELGKISGEKVIWPVGELVKTRLLEAGVEVGRSFEVPHSLTAIAPLVSGLLRTIDQALSSGGVTRIYLFVNRPSGQAGYAPASLEFLPPGRDWSEQFESNSWPPNRNPEVLFDTGKTVRSVIREYFFVTLYRACAESLVAENGSRLAAMQRAEKNIEDMVEQMSMQYHQLRQITIDEELFDVLAGADASAEEH